jgi:putative transferase (TIGR04331 family)
VVSRVLIATALEETWPSNNEPVLFLGEWCRLYSRKSAWAGMDAMVAPYHWDNRKKLHADYIYLQGLSDKLLVELSKSLNEIHGVNHSIRYWRILVGPWLCYFIQILFDRWAMLVQVQRDEDILCINLKRKANINKFVPNDTEEFISFFLRDEWNDFIYREIAEWMGISVESRELIQQEIEDQRVLNADSNSRRSGAYLKKVINYVFGLLGRDDEYFFISTYLGLKQNLLVQIKLGQVPKLWQSIVASEVVMCENARRWKMLGGGDQEFEHLVCALIPKNIPKLYLEGYSNLQKISLQAPWPKTPKTIFTCNSFISDDVFKAWAARKVEKGAPFVIGQHGGNYGMALWNFSEDHQLAIADRYMTWGWIKCGQENIDPIGNFKKMLSTLPNCNGSALLVETTVPLQGYHMFSAPVGAGQWQEYFHDQTRFVMALPENLRTKLLVRLSPQDYGYSQKQRWKDFFPNIELDSGSCPISTLMNRSRISIITYNATAYLESMALNFPTIIFWNPIYWELRKDALPIFEKLKKVGIFHEAPESAAQHLENIWNGVSDWWFSAKVQAVRMEFCEKYVRTNSSIASSLAESFRKLS